MVHTLALLEPALVGFVPSGLEFGNQMQLVASLLQEGKKPEALDTFLHTVFEGSPNYREIIEKQLPSGAYDIAVRDLDIMFRLEAPALQTWDFTTDDAKHITQPVLYVGGENSALYFQEIHKLVLTWFPQADTKMLPNMSHMLHVKNPKLIADVLRDFFAQHSLR
jgi:pimeloyl-ACP methyl ester carboxylesterase